jgi:hypothetical protein
MNIGLRYYRFDVTKADIHSLPFVIPAVDEQSAKLALQKAFPGCDVSNGRYLMTSYVEVDHHG